VASLPSHFGANAGPVDDAEVVHVAAEHCQLRGGHRYELEVLDAAWAEFLALQTAHP